MRKIDISLIEALTVALGDAVQQHKDSIGGDQEKLYLVRMNFIKSFTEDVWFLNDLSGQINFNYRYGYAIIREMLEQLIEFLYVKKNLRLINEYLGDNIDCHAIQNAITLVEKEHLFGKERYTNTRPSVAKMAKSINEFEADNGHMSLYDLYCILSERCHNSYFDGLLKKIVSMECDVTMIGLTEDQITMLHNLITCVLIEYGTKN